MTDYNKMRPDYEALTKELRALVDPATPDDHFTEADAVRIIDGAVDALNCLRKERALYLSPDTVPVDEDWLNALTQDYEFVRADRDALAAVIERVHMLAEAADGDAGPWFGPEEVLGIIASAPDEALAERDRKNREEAWEGGRCWARDTKPAEMPHRWVDANPYSKHEEASDV